MTSLQMNIMTLPPASSFSSFAQKDILVTVTHSKVHQTKKRSFEMEELQNFGPNDVQNGTLAQMFRNAGINDVQSYVADVRHENVDLSEQSNRSGGSLNNAQSLFD